MNLAELFDRVPKPALIGGGIFAAFLIAVGVSFGIGGGGDDSSPSRTPTSLAAGPDSGATTTPTVRPSPSVAPTATPLVPRNREDCGEIQGTDYLSPEERQWYLENCADGNAAAGGGGAEGGPGVVLANEYSIGARLIIPSLGINATVTGATVGPDGIMPDPVGYFNAVLYDFPSHPGLGGSNKVMAAHVDCAHCNNGGPGTALFWSVRNLSPGATAQFVDGNGNTTNYVVVSSYAVSPSSNWDSIVASGAADMTLITCTGTFAGGEYSDRHVVQLRVQG